MSGTVGMVNRLRWLTSTRAAGEGAVDAGHPGRVVAVGGAEVAERRPLGRTGELGT